MESLSSNSSPVDRLRVTIEQTTSSPLTITSTVVNENTYPVTFLLYNSPLDTIAPTIGLLTITPEGALQPLELPEIQIRREWPPSPDSLIQLEPGASQTAEIVLKDFITSQLDKKASVVLKGHWDMVWTKQKDDITVDMIEQSQAQPNPDMFTGSFATGSLEITTV
ncbi:putative secreted protein [Trichoderma lentiforme]|uniref:Secreted protein n=1 Tax=Trichoderma lentiforme TaxID=1567552 RepID=A0A9P4XCP5_9HYPO|nr:putative secreted protein [Trichoderma lentiforme]